MKTKIHSLKLYELVIIYAGLFTIYRLLPAWLTVIKQIVSPLLVVNIAAVAYICWLKLRQA